MLETDQSNSECEICTEPDISEEIRENFASQNSENSNHVKNYSIPLNTDDATRIRIANPQNVMIYTQQNK